MKLSAWQPGDTVRKTMSTDRMKDLWLLIREGIDDYWITSPDNVEATKEFHHLLCAFAAAEPAGRADIQRGNVCRHGPYATFCKFCDAEQTDAAARN